MLMIHLKSMHFKDILLKSNLNLFYRIRQPKIFYVSTSDAETTISANTACWTSSTNAATTCGKRKRRALILDAANPQSEKIAPTREAIKKVDEEFEESLDRNLDSGLVEEGENREPKFVYYWMTTTR